MLHSTIFSFSYHYRSIILKSLFFHHFIENYGRFFSYTYSITEYVEFLFKFFDKKINKEMFLKIINLYISLEIMLVTGKILGIVYYILFSKHSINVFTVFFNHKVR